MKPENLVKKSRAVVLRLLLSQKLEGNEKEAILASESALDCDKEFVPAALIRTGLISDVKSQRKLFAYRVILQTEATSESLGGIREALAEGGGSAKVPKITKSIGS